MPEPMTPEVPNTPENPLQSWENKVKQQIKNGQAFGSMTDHANFHIENGNIIAEPGDNNYNKGAGKFVLGERNTRQDADDIYNLFMGVNTYDQGFPATTKEGVQYLTFTDLNPNSVPPSSKATEAKLQKKYGDNKTAIEFQFQQWDTEGKRPDTRKVHLIVPQETAHELETIVEKGINPNEVYETVANIFTTPETRPYFYATKVDPDDNKTITINPGPPNFETTFISKTIEGKKTERKLIHHDPDTTWIEKAPVEPMQTNNKYTEPININNEPSIDDQDTPVHNTPLSGAGQPPSEPPTEPPIPFMDLPEPEPNKNSKNNFDEKINKYMSGDNPEIKSQYAQDLLRGYIDGIGRNRSALENTLKQGQRMYMKYSSKDFETKEEWYQFRKDWEKIRIDIRQEADRLNEEVKPRKETSNKQNSQIPPELIEIFLAQQQLIQEQHNRARQTRRMSGGGEFGIDFRNMGMSKGEGKEDEQREYVRGLLNKIENSNRDTQGMGNLYVVMDLEASYDDMEDSVAREVRARLAVHDCSELMKQANGWIFREADKVGPGYSIGSAATMAENLGHALNEEIKNTFLEDSTYLPGLDVPRAWNLLEEINDRDEYENWVIRAGLKLEDKDKGKLNFIKDGNLSRKRAVREVIYQEILSTSTVVAGDFEARKSLQLAEKFSRATLEDSVFNRGETAGNDQLGEVIGLREWRAGRKRANGRVRGPKIHETQIEGFGTSWVRSQQKPPNLDILNAKDVVVKDDWVYYCTVLVTKYKQLNEILLDRQPKINGFNLTFLQNAVDWFDKADKPEKDKGHLGPAKLRAYWVAGVLDMVLADRTISLDGRPIVDAMNAFHKALTKDELAPGYTFIEEETWESIAQEINYSSRLRARSLADSIRGSLKF